MPPPRTFGGSLKRSKVLECLGGKVKHTWVVPHIEIGSDVHAWVSEWVCACASRWVCAVSASEAIFPERRLHVPPNLSTDFVECVWLLLRWGKPHQLLISASCFPQPACGASCVNQVTTRAAFGDDKRQLHLSGIDISVNVIWHLRTSLQTACFFRLQLLYGFYHGRYTVNWDVFCSIFADASNLCVDLLWLVPQHFTTCTEETQCGKPLFLKSYTHN